MEASFVVYPPNRPLDRPMAPSKSPVLYDNLFFIEISPKSEVLVGCSNVSGTYWEGTLMYYKDIPSAVENNYANYFISPTATLDAKFFNNSNHILLSEHNNLLKLLSVSENVGENSSLKCEDEFENNGIIDCIAVWDRQCKFVTCSGNCVSVWDTQDNSTLNLIKEYRNYHTEIVTCVDVNPSQPNTFASVGVDRRACVWDDRMESSATVVYSNEFSAFTTVSWNPVNIDLIVIGSDAGNIYLVDVRQPKEFMHMEKCFDSGMHRTVFNKDGKLAVCGGDTNEVQAFSVLEDSMPKVYSNTQHKGIVRGLAWFYDTLYSCGFDKKIVEHAW